MLYRVKEILNFSYSANLQLEENRMERPTPDNENEEELKEKDLVSWFA